MCNVVYIIIFIDAKLTSRIPRGVRLDERFIQENNGYGKLQIVNENNTKVVDKLYVHTNQYHSS